MDTLSAFLVIGVYGLLILFFGRILKKAGFSHWWALFVLIPGIGIIMLWIFAFSKWPRYSAEHRN